MTGSAEPLRLGIDGRELRPGVRTGIGRYVASVVREAVRAGWDCRVYGDPGTRMPPELSRADLRILPGRLTPWWDQVTLPRRLARDRVSVFLSPYYKGPIVAPCPVVVTVHDVFFLDYGSGHSALGQLLLLRLARLYARRATAVVTDSEYSKRAIVARLGLREAAVTVIPVALGDGFAPAPLTEDTRRRYGIAPPYVLYVGNFKPHKNVEGLLRAYRRLPEPVRCAHQLVLAGGDAGRRPALETLARELGLGDRVCFTGAVTEEDLPALYTGCALFVLPSLEEGFGLPALEAMACGAPVLASSRAALPEVTGDAAVLVDPADEGALAGAMEHLLADAAARAALSVRGRARASAFGPAETAGRVLALLRLVAGAGR